MEKLTETYAKRLAVSESVYAKAHDNGVMSTNIKNCVATVIDNETKFLNEAFSNSVGTQRANLGDFKKFCLNLTTVALPNLIAHDLVIVSPMSSYSGYITYVRYTSGTNKGATRQGDVFNDPFRLGTHRAGQAIELDRDFTSSKVVESVTSFTSGTTKMAWTPCIVGDCRVFAADGTEIKTSDEKAGATIAADGTVTLKDGVSGTVAKVAYEYDNVVIPQNDLPIVNAEIVSLPLVAKARRVAVYYSQIAAFQAKQDYGFDLGDQLAEKACGQLAYEIDTEITDLLIKNAAVDSSLSWSKVIPTGVNKADHYEGFAEVVEIAKAKIYDKTQRYAPNYMICASDIVPILTFIKGFKAASTGSVNGPYMAGTLNGIKVFVTPNIAQGKFVLGVNGDDMMSSAAVYAPYMAVVPTQLLGYADGSMSQGWSTMYALELLNKDLLIAGQVTTDKQLVETHANE